MLWFIWFSRLLFARREKGDNFTSLASAALCKVFLLTLLLSKIVLVSLSVLTYNFFVDDSFFFFILFPPQSSTGCFPHSMRRWKKKTFLTTFLSSSTSFSPSNQEWLPTNIWTSLMNKKDTCIFTSGRPNRIPNLFVIIRYSVFFGENRTEYLQGKIELLIVLRRVFRGKN